jgi:hypothetical protein
VSDTPKTPAPALPAGGPALFTPLQAEVIEAGFLPDPDALGISMVRHDMAMSAGYDENGPPSLPGPKRTGGAADAEAFPPVLQWDIDPDNSAFVSGEADVTRDGWDYAIWWQRHPAGLLYVSIQALDHQQERMGPAERLPPLGRNVVVNLVYDEARRAVVAVYGTARDFQPFVDAFREGLHLDPAAGETQS